MATIRRGIKVKKERIQENFIQVSYKEGNQYPNADYINFQIMSWVESFKLTTKVIWHFYHLEISFSSDKWR